MWLFGSNPVEDCLCLVIYADRNRDSRFSTLEFDKRLGL